MSKGGRAVDQANPLPMALGPAGEAGERLKPQAVSDQLRQRAALALSQILVVSGTTVKLPYAMANYQRIFLNNAFGWASDGY